jgi:hypothetical protein
VSTKIRNRNRRIWLLLDRPLHDVGKARCSILRLAIEVLSRARDLLRLTLDLGLRISGDPPETFFDFPAEVLGGASYPIFVHPTSPRASVSLRRLTAGALVRFLSVGR